MRGTGDQWFTGPAAEIDDHISGLLADPALIRTEINNRLEQVRTADPATVQRQRLDAALAKATSSITRLISAFHEELISLDELRTRTPDLRARETSLRHQIEALDTQLADREVYLKLAYNLEGFLTGLRTKTSTASDTPSRSAATPRAAGPRAAPKPTRRATLGPIAHCVGGVTAPDCGTPVYADPPR